MVDERLMILYQEMILDHGRQPRFCHKLENYDLSLEGFNPLCGDRLTLYIQLDKETGLIKQASFEGQGCAISMASASMMLESIQNVSPEKALELFGHFHSMLLSEQFEPDSLGKLTLLEGVKAFPSRIKCASLPWHTLDGCLNHKCEKVTTEK